MTDAVDHARSVVRQNAEQLLLKPNVVAVGVGYKITQGQTTDTVCAVCSVSQKVAASKLASRDLVPPALQDLPTDVVATGAIRALASHTERYRPAPGGVSIGHRDITTGTLGCVVKKNGVRVILSNNHVLANSNSADIGDPILQPGPYDGGRYPADQIAVLEDYVPIQFPDTPSDCGLAKGLADVANKVAGLMGSKTRLQAVAGLAVENRVDAAIARPLQDPDVSDEILEIGTLTGLGQGELGMAIQKSGRTTAYTQGEITQIDVTVNVQYGAGKVARFTDQLMAGPMSQGGDSGSAVLDQDKRLVGLLFAGSDNSTIINRIEHVFAALRLSL